MRNKPLISETLRTFFPFAIAVAVAGAAADSLTEMSAHHWYLFLKKPSWAPPPQVFSPIWAGLYALMALAAWLVYKKEGWTQAQKPLHLWGIQLILSALWPGCFFALRNPALGSIETAILLTFVIATTLSFWKYEKKAGYLMIPYCLWGSFATALTFTLWHMNR